MGLLSIIKKAKMRDKEMRILMLGLDNSGKTTIVKRFNGEDVNTISPTLGFSINTMEFMDYRLNVWDIGGQKSIRSFWRNYFESTDGLVWVVDSADLNRLEDCRRELHTLLKEERLAGATLMVFANKQDLGGAITKQQVIELLQLERMAKRHWAVFECSARQEDSRPVLIEGMSWLVKDIGERIF